MHRIGERAARVFKLLAGQAPDEDMGPYVIALYVFLSVIAMVFCFAWMVGGSMEGAVCATC
jgi:hypothetical protein